MKETPKAVETKEEKKEEKKIEFVEVEFTFKNGFMKKQKMTAYLFVNLQNIFVSDTRDKKVTTEFGAKTFGIDLNEVVFFEIVNLF